MWLHRVCRPQALPSKPQYFVSLPSFPGLLCLCMWERPVECGWSVPAVASLLTLISFSIAHLDPSSGEIADWWVCPATKDTGKTQPQPKEHEGWKTPSGLCNLKSIKTLLGFFFFSFKKNQPCSLLLLSAVARNHFGCNPLSVKEKVQRDYRIYFALFSSFMHSFFWLTSLWTFPLLRA